MNWDWNTDKRPIAMTEEVAKMFIGQIVEAVNQAKQSDLLEHFKSFAQVQIELGQARSDLQRSVEKAQEEIARKDAEIAGLRLHIERLMSMLAPGNAQFGAYAPYNNNGSQPVSSIPATFPVPMPPAPATYQTYTTITGPQDS